MAAEAAEQSEPTMEEILASIRKIIASEGPPTQPAEDIIELTDMVEEEPEPAAPEPEPEPEPIVEPVIEEVAAAAPPPMPEPVEEPVVEQAPPEEPKMFEPAPEALVSEIAGTVAATSFSQLAEQLEKQRVPLDQHVEIGNGQQTLENLVTEIMRPLLKEWLDQNLPTTVERLVRSEIERIARRHS